jgi:long-subunit acyl-CoA synthetase (AMP-forming)
MLSRQCTGRDLLQRLPGDEGIYKNPEATAEVIDKDGFLHSGDLGFRDEKGNYHITGELKT